MIGPMRKSLGKINLILLLSDQLTLDIAAIKKADKSKDYIIMAEVDAEAEYVKHHPKKSLCGEPLHP